jgi:hypothetical protein
MGVTNVLLNWDYLNIGKIGDMLWICPNFDRFSANDFLPYVLNPLILLKLIQNNEKRVEVNINNGNSKLQ